MDFNFYNENDPWEFSLDIDDFDLHLTPVLRPSSSTRVEPSPSTPNPVRIIPGLAGIVQQAKPSGYCPNPVRIIPGRAGAALILANVSVFSLKPTMHYLYITKRNVVQVFRKDTIRGSDSD
nr:hypothetical protein [Tanacetum cinerariifolium]